MTHNIARIIHQNLFQRDELVIPGLGKLYKTAHEARLNYGSKTITPPQQNLAFERSYTDDVELVDLVADHYGIPAEAAEDLVVDFVTDLQSRLRETRSVHLNEIGVFYLKSNGDIHLIADEVNYDSAGFGLPVLPIQAIPLEVSESESEKKVIASSGITSGLNPGHDVYREKEEKTVDPHPILVAPAIPATPVVSRSESKPENEDRKVKRVWTAYMPVVIAAVICLSLLAHYLIIHDRASDYQLLPISNVRINQKPKKSEGDRVIPDSQTEESSDRVETEETTNPDNSMTPPASPTEGTSNCMIVAGAFGQAANANRMSDVLRTQGFDVVHMEHNGLTRVGVQTTCQSEHLGDALASIRVDVSPQAWVLEKDDIKHE